MRNCLPCLTAEQTAARQGIGNFHTSAQPPPTELVLVWVLVSEWV
jgi:hypothetical protein